MMTNEIENNEEVAQAEEASSAAGEMQQEVRQADSAATEHDQPASAEESTSEEQAPESDSKIPTNPKFKWYVVHVYSGFEEKAKNTLLSRIRQFEKEEAFGEIFIPKTITERVLKSGKRKQVEKTSYPGYMLVEMEMNDVNRTFVRQTPRVTGFIGGNQMDPRPISDAEVLRLTSPEAAREIERSQKMTVQYTVGERVKVTDGAFANFEGVVDEVKPEKSKVLVLVSIFGRETPVELDYAQVQKLS